MREIGRFRTVAIDDLGRNLYHGNTAQMREDLRFLRDRGLVQLRTARTRGQGGKLPVVVLTKVGKNIAARALTADRQILERQQAPQPRRPIDL
jgi:hypothetical protein